MAAQAAPPVDVLSDVSRSDRLCAFLRHRLSKIEGIVRKPVPPRRPGNRYRRRGSNSVRPGVMGRSIPREWGRETER